MTVSPEARFSHSANLRDECAFLWMMRDRCVSAPNIRLLDLVRLDERLAAFCDSLGIAQRGLACPLAGSASEPGDFFADVAAALLADMPDGVHAVLATVPDRGCARAATSALAWFGTGSDAVIAELQYASEAALRAIALAALGARRTDPGPALAGALADPSAVVRARACRTAGQLGRVDLMAQLRDGLGDTDAECRFWSAWSAARMAASEDALGVLADIAWNALPHAGRALDLLLRRLDVPQALAWLREFARLPGRQRDLIRATGVIGDPIYIPWLIERMAEPGTARLAGAAASMITGLDLAYRDLDRKPPPDFVSGPNDDPVDEDVALDEDEHLPWPDPQRIGQWWTANRKRFASGTGYFLGVPKAAADWLECLSDGFQRQRHAAALELAIRQPDKAMFEVRARGRRQRQMLARVRGVSKS